jgi:hypothetical protein
MFFLDEDIQSSQEEFIEEESPVYQKTRYVKLMDQVQLAVICSSNRMLPGFQELM